LATEVAAELFKGGGEVAIVVCAQLGCGSFQMAAGLRVSSVMRSPSSRLVTRTGTATRATDPDGSVPIGAVSMIASRARCCERWRSKACQPGVKQLSSDAQRVPQRESVSDQKQRKGAAAGADGKRLQPQQDRSVSQLSTGTTRRPVSQSWPAIPAAAQARQARVAATAGAQPLRPKGVPAPGTPRRYRWGFGPAGYPDELRWARTWWRTCAHGPGPG